MLDFSIQTNGLCKRFGDRKAVDRVSINVPYGAFVSIFGPNGAGKTTLLRMLATIVRPSEGTARVCGFDLKEEPDAIRARIGFIGHEPMVYPDLSALQNLELYAGLYGTPDPSTRALELLDAVGLKHRRFDTVRTFSKGMTQRLAIARALINNPELVLLDEPYNGLDPHAMQVLDRIIDDTRAKRTVVMVSHNLEKGIDAATHLLLMSKGTCSLFCSKDDISLDAFRETYRQSVRTQVS